MRGSAVEQARPGEDESEAGQHDRKGNQLVGEGIAAIAQAKRGQRHDDEANAEGAMDQIGLGAGIQPADQERQYQGGAGKGDADEQRRVVDH